MLSGKWPRWRPTLPAAALAAWVAFAPSPAGAQSAPDSPSPSAPLAAPASAPLAAAEPRPSRLPAFIFLGVGGLMGGGALATGVVAKLTYDDARDTCGPACSDSQLSNSRTFAVTSTVLTGAAALGIGLGVALLLTTPEDESEAFGLVPRWDVRVTPRAAAASAAWAF